MNLTNTATIKSLLAKHGLRPNKVMGQHFLVSESALAKIVKAARLDNTDVVLEVGPGLGVLTQELVKHAGRVIAIEKDLKLIEVLADVIPAKAGIQIVHGDILKLDPADYGLGALGYKIVADIPYYLTSRLFRQFLESPHQPSCMILLVQKEVAERIGAKPPKATLLSNAVQYYADVVMVGKVPKSAFYPPPKVDSEIINLVVKRKYDAIFDNIFFKLLKVGFSAPRKQVFGNISKIHGKENATKWLYKAGIAPSARPQTITLDQWIALVAASSK
ncbi:MAG: 16S rRNA (adenine(1518)-N(6)/adenine(1519)-N(6))-dimethyltransferase RsmA [bacterium]|nr:16S rRNA (adenine(1518)-N(6)/adenine(1519)-N(6))-dimethyltransferase RsmA [bacterium]